MHPIPHSILITLIGLAATSIHTPFLSAAEPKVLKGHSNEVLCLAFAEDNKTLVSASRDGTVRIWDVTTDKVKTVIELPHQEIYRMALSRDASLVAISSSPLGFSPETLSLHVYDLTEKKRLWKLSMDKGNGDCMALSPDGKTLAASSHEVKSNDIMLWEPATKKELGCLKGGGRVAAEMVYSPDGKWLAIAARRAEVQVWDTAKGKLVSEFQVLDKSRAIFALAFSPDGKDLAVGAFNQQVRIFDWKAKKLIAEGEGQTYCRNALVYSPDGKLLATQKPTEGLALCLLETKSYTKYKSMGSDDETLEAVAFSPDGKLIATGGRDDLIRIRKVPKD